MMYIESSDVRVSFGDAEILKGITAAVPEKKFIGIIGPNGSGKSTFLKCVYRVLRPGSGAILLDGKFLDQYPYKESAKRISVVAQHNYYNFEFSVQEVVLMGRAPHKKALEHDGAKDYQIVRKALETVGMAEFANRSFSTLSGGEQQRVILARALAQDTPCLILDEPTNHLDITSKEILEDALNRYTGTVLYVSHDRYFINRTAGRILELENGALTGYAGNYDYYLEKKAQLEQSLSGQPASRSDGTEQIPGKGGLSGNASAGSAPAARGKNAAASPASESALKQDWKSQKEAQAAQRKKENALKRCEERITVLEERSAQIDAEMALPEVCTDVAKLQTLSKEKAQIEEELLAKMEEWEALSE